MPRYEVAFYRGEILVTIRKNAQTIEALIEWIRKTFQVDEKVISSITEIGD